MALGAVMMLMGALTAMSLKEVAPYIFTVGALAYVAMQILQRYDGQNITVQRLRRIMILSDVLLILSALLMIADHGNRFGLDQMTWLTYVHNNWIIVLLIAAVLQLYTVFRIDSELRKEAKKP